MMMEVQQRLACLSPTQRLTVLPAPPALRPLPPPVSPPARHHSKTMIIELDHASPNSPPTSPPQGEILPNGVSEGHERNSHVGSLQKESGGLLRKFQNESGAETPLPAWSGGSETGMMNNGVEEFSQPGMAREGLEEEGSASPGQHSPRPLEDPMPDHFRGRESMEECYTPLTSRVPHMPMSGQELGRRRRKPGLEDIVRRRRSELETNAYSFDPLRGEDHPGENHHHHRPEDREDIVMPTEDEVDGGAPQHLTREEISRQLMNAQACAESAIKQSMQQSGFENMDRDIDEDEEELEGEDSYHHFSPHDGYFVRPRPDDEFEDEEDEDEISRGSPDFHRPGGPWDPRLGFTPPYPEDRRRLEREDVDKKPEVTILPKTGLHHLPGGLPHGHHHPLSSESAYSPHHLASPKMNGWFPGMPPLFPPFGPGGLMDGPPGMGHKFLPFHEGKIITEIDKDYLKCNYCERTFRRQKNLENHIESTHQKGSPDQRPKRESADMYFKCSHCPYTTKHQSNLYVHLRIHTGERPYICGACGVQYSQSHSLKSHIINKHEGHMNFYIKEKRNRSPRGMGYLSTQVTPGDHGTIFKMPPPPAMPHSLQQSNMEIVQRAIEMARNSLSNELQGPPPPLMHPTSSSLPPHSPLMSPNGPGGGSHHSLFSKAGFPFGGHFHGMGLPFPDLPANPAAAMMNRPQQSPGSRNGLPGGAPGLVSPGNPVLRNELLHLPPTSGGPMPGSVPVFNMAPPGLLSPASGKVPHPHQASPGSQHLMPGAPSTSTPARPSSSSGSSTTTAAPGKTPGKDSGDCGAMDLTTKGGPGVPDSKRPGDCASCVNCSHGNKLKLLRLNVVRMLTILVPNLNFEEKGISADSDSVDELLQDVIESNTQDDMVH